MALGSSCGGHRRLDPKEQLPLMDKNSDEKAYLLQERKEDPYLYRSDTFTCKKIEGGVRAEQGAGKKISLVEKAVRDIGYEDAYKDITLECCVKTPSEHGQGKCQALKKSEFYKKDAKFTVLNDGYVAKNSLLMLSPKEYWDYIADKVKKPEDVVYLMRFLLEYREVSDDRLLSSEAVLEQGGGDCDNLSNVAVNLLRRLGQREGFDYQPRIVGWINHAVCVFRGKDGKWKAIDQVADIKTISDENGKINLRSASSIFLEKAEKGEGSSEKFSERQALAEEKYGVGACFDVEIDTVTLDKTNELLLAKWFIPLTKDFDPNRMLPQGWREYGMVQVGFFQEKVTIFYKKGILFQKQYGEGGVETEDFDPSTGTLTQRRLRGGNVGVEFFDPSTGKLVERHFREGGISAERFDEKGGKLVERQYRQGKIELDWFDPESGKLSRRAYREGAILWEAFDGAGKIIQKSYRQGKIEREVFDPATGSLVQRNYREGQCKYAIEWYDAKGKVIQVQTWKGEVQSR